MSDLLCVTNRHLCRGDFFARLESLCQCAPAGILLREKDLSPEAYAPLAKRALSLCKAYGVLCILHTHTEAACALHASAFHAPLPVLRQLTAAQKAAFSTLGASCHSVADAREAQQLGCTYLTAGHIFDTDCKQGLPGRGLPFLAEVCRSVPLPVYAIGGIAPENIGAVRAAGAAGGCVMSGCMTCNNCNAYFSHFEKAGIPHEI